MVALSSSSSSLAAAAAAAARPRQLSPSLRSSPSALSSPPAPRLASWRARIAHASTHRPRAVAGGCGLDEALFAISQAADAAVQGVLGGGGVGVGGVGAPLSAWLPAPSSALSPASLAVVWAAGVATSLSPCTLSVLPLTLGFLAASGPDGGGGGGARRLPAQALAFSAGLATTLAALGVASALAGRAYGVLIGGGGGGEGGPGAAAAAAAGAALPVAAGALAVVSGLALLDALPPRWTAAVLWALRPPPAAERLLRRGVEMAAAAAATSGPLAAAAPRPSSSPWPRLGRAYAAGLVAALAASPCATPVLASILAWVSATRDPLAGATLLACYSAGFVSPLLVAGAVAEAAAGSAAAAAASAAGAGAAADASGAEPGGGGDDSSAAAARRVATLIPGVGGGGEGSRGVGAPAATSAAAGRDVVRTAVRGALESGASTALSRGSGVLLVAGGVYAVLTRVVPG